MPDRPDFLPRPAFPRLRPEPGGFEAALTVGRRRRRRALGGSALLSTVLLATTAYLSLSSGTPQAANLEFTQLPDHTSPVSVDGTEVNTGVAAPATPGQPVGQQTPAVPGATSAPDTAARPIAPAPTVSPLPGAPGPSPVTKPGVRRSDKGAPIGCAADIDGPGNIQRYGAWCLEPTVAPVEGENAQTFALAVCHQATDAGALHFATAQSVDFTVRAGGETYWRWARGQRFAAQPRTVGVDGNSCAVWSVVWDQVDENGELVPVGEYALTLRTYATELKNAAETTVTFTVT